MKKAQILSAIALAFALGVVAPVAGANALVIADNTVTPNVEGTATRTDLNNAVAAVEGNTTYKNMLAVIDAAAKVKDGDYADVTTEVTAVTTALKNNTPAGVTMGESELAKPTNQQIIDAAKTTTDYSIYASVKTAIANNDLTTLKSTLVNDYNKIKGVTAVDVSTITDASKYDATKLTNWSYYNALIEAVNEAQEAVDAEKAGLDALKAALPKVLNVDGKDALKALEEAGNVTVAGLAALATDDNIDGYTKWEAVKTAVDNAEPNNSGETNPNYTKLMAIATAYKAATNNLTDTAEQVAANLVAYVAPEQKPEDGDKPGDNNGDDQKDPSAPGTGVLSSADGNAATTVSIVAGLATALTALGAGVVAYRSARRSNK